MNNSSKTIFHEPGSSISYFVDIFLLLCVALSLRLAYGISHPLQGDELFQYLAAIGWIENGAPSIAEGVYNRALAFIFLLKETMTFLGRSVEIARIWPLFFSLAWIALFYVWLRSKSSRLVAFLAAFFLAVAPHSIELGVFVRMYTMHAVFFTGLMIVFFEALSVRSLTKAITLLVIAIPLFAMSVHLQQTTLIGVFGIGASIAILLILQYFDWKYTPALSSIGVLTFLAVGVIWLTWAVKPELVIWINQRITFESFAEGSRGLWWYTNFFTKQYSLAWFLTPIAMLLAIRENRLLGIYLSIAFTLIFALHSIVGASAERYIFYAMPMLFAIWSIALVSAIPAIQNFIEQRIKLNRIANFRALGANSAAKILMVCILIICLPLSDAFRRTVNLVRGESYYIGVEHANWQSVSGKLKQLAAESRFVLTTDFLETELYVGHFDMTYSPVIVHDILNGVEFAVDPRSGRQVIGSLASLQSVLNVHKQGIIIGDVRNLNNPLRINERVFQYIERYMYRVPLNSESLVFAYIWGGDLQSYEEEVPHSLAAQPAMP